MVGKRKKKQILESIQGLKTLEDYRKFEEKHEKKSGRSSDASKDAVRKAKRARSLMGISGQNNASVWKQIGDHGTSYQGGLVS